MKKFLLFVLAGIILSVSQVSGQEVINSILKRGEINIGTTADFFPFTFKDKKTGELNGIDILMGKALAREMGVKPNFIVMEFEDLIPAVTEGKVDIVLSGLSITTKRNTKVAFAGSYYHTGKALLSFDSKLSKGEKEVVNKESVKLAAIGKSTSEMFIKTHYPKATIVSVKDVNEAKKLLADKKVNGIVVDYDVCEKVEFSIKNGKLYYQNLSKKTEYEYIAPAVSAKDPLFVNLVSNFIMRVNAYNMQEEIDKIWLQYLNQ